MKKAKSGKADKAVEVVNIAEQMAENVQDKEAKLTGQLADFLGTAAADADMTTHDLIERCATVDCLPLLTCLPRRVLVLIWALRVD